MGVNSIQISTSSSTDSVSTKKSNFNSQGGEEKLFEEFFSALYQQVCNSTEDCPKDCNTVIEQSLDAITCQMINPELFSGIISRFSEIKRPSDELQPVIPKLTKQLCEDLVQLDSENISGSSFEENLIKMNIPFENIAMANSQAEDINNLQSLDILKNLIKKYSQSNQEGTIDADNEIVDLETAGNTTGSTEIAHQVKNSTDEINNIIEQTKDQNNSNNISDASSNTGVMEASINKKNVDGKDKKDGTFSVNEKSFGVGKGIASTSSSPDTVKTPLDMPGSRELPSENIDKIIKGFKALKLPDSTEISVKLTPEELGEVTVKVVLEKGRITGHITAESKDVALMLQNKLDYLKQEMQFKNVNLSNISVSVFTGSDQGNGHQSARDFLNKHGRRAQSSQGYAEDITVNDDNDQNDGLNIIA